MFYALQVLTLILVVLALVPALAHALELPGKLRLTREAYCAVQPIYYPGFTVAGISEPLAIISMLVLLLLSATGSAAFWLTLAALLGLIGMQTVYWLFTHPVNNFWLQGEKLSAAGSGFFSFGSRRKGSHREEAGPAHWTELRNQWEYSHVARAGLAGLSFVSLVIAVTSDS